MNKKIVGIFILTITALVILTLFSFGPLAGKRKSGSVNPASLKPQTTQQVASYHNKDMKENYYAVNIPKDWQVQSLDDNLPGGYNLKSIQAKGIIDLIDVPDNTTLELFILSQEEPQIKKNLAGYKRITYKKLNINNREAYQLVYSDNLLGDPGQTARTYISGPDKAAVITLFSKQTDFTALEPLFMTILNSFQWENK